MSKSKRKQLFFIMVFSNDSSNKPRLDIHHVYSYDPDSALKLFYEQNAVGSEVIDIIVGIPNFI